MPTCRFFARLRLLLAACLLSVVGQPVCAQAPLADSVRLPALRPPRLSSATDTVFPPTLNSARLRIVVGGSALSYGALYGTLAAGWYDGPKAPFHWFDDSREWAQLDKCGHFWGAFHESRGAVDLLRWAGVPRRQARIWGAPFGFLVQSPLEYFDGRQAQYGASWTDLAANAAGALTLAGELALWDEIRLQPKISYHLTSFAAQRPNTLGRTVAERLLKDYNGQTYWLSADVGAFLGPDSRWPRWLNVAAGYGATGLVYGDPAFNRANGFQTTRLFYLAPDINLQGIRTRSKLLRRVFYALNLFRLPLPALEFSGAHGIRLQGFR